VKGRPPVRTVFKISPVASFASSLISSFYRLLATEFPYAPASLRVTSPPGHHILPLMANRVWGTRFATLSLNSPPPSPSPPLSPLLNVSESSESEHLVDQTNSAAILNENEASEANVKTGPKLPHDASIFVGRCVRLILVSLHLLISPLSVFLFLLNNTNLVAFFRSIYPNILKSRM
jgi:hypothetical protein